MNLNTLAIRSLVVLIAGLLAAQALRNKGAAVRHLIYASTLISLLLLPLVRRWMPMQALPPQTIPAPIQHLVSQLPTIPADPLNIQGVAGGGMPMEWPVLVGQGLLALWVIGILILAARLCFAIVRLAALVKRSERLQLERFDTYELRTSREILVPSTAWMGRNVILLPDSYRSWSPERLESVVLHEAAHIARKDWFVQLCGRIACALYWPNPLVWVAQRGMLDCAEQAADDTVLLAGVAPSRYAEDLLHIAASVRRRPALMIPMAVKSDVGRRIKMVLDAKKRRGSVSLVSLLVAGLGIAAVSVPAANLMLQDLQSDKTSFYADIRDGKTISACEENDYTATFQDGRHVQLFQIGWHRPDGTFLAWRPNGTLLSGRDVYPAQYHGDQQGMMEFVYRVSSITPGGQAGMGSGPTIVGEPAEQAFSGNWNLKPSKDGTTVVVSLMDIPKPGSSNLSSYSFAITDGPRRTVVSYDVATHAISSDGSYAQDIKVTPNALAPLFTFDKNGNPVKDAKGDYVRKPTASIQVEYDYPRAPMTYSPQVVGITGTGKVVESIFGGGADYRDKQYIPMDAGVERIEVQVQRISAANLLGVHIRPNGLASP